MATIHILDSLTAVHENEMDLDGRTITTIGRYYKDAIEPDFVVATTHFRQIPDQSVIHTPKDRSADLYISRNHAAIKRLQDGYYVSDNQSKNGTRLNGEALPPFEDVRLRHGDVIELARHVRLEFREPA
ncbi:MAG: FHA domain-containing protein [Planctomycetes bacterium]|nr:FHA domain-containing protein [Planctomycetota bacterium]